MFQEKFGIYSFQVKEIMERSGNVENKSKDNGRFDAKK